MILRAFFVELKLILNRRHSNCLSSMLMIMPSFQANQGLTPPPFVDPRPTTPHSITQNIHSRQIHMHRFSIIFLCCRSCFHATTTTPPAIGRIGSSFCFITLNKQGKRGGRRGWAGQPCGWSLWSSLLGTPWMAQRPCVCVCECAYNIFD